MAIACVGAFGCALSADADQRETEHPQQRTAHGDAPTTSPAVQPRGDKPTQSQTEDHQQSAHDLWEFFIERVVDPVTWFTFFLFVTSVAQWLAMRRQAETMEGQLDQMEGQAGDMKASIEQATRTAAAMERIATAMAASVENVERSLVISREIADTNKEIALSQRAYLNIIDVQLGPHGPNRVPTIAIELHNSGSKPATVLEYATILWTGEGLPDPYGSKDPLQWLAASGVAAPGHSITLASTHPDPSIGQLEWDKLRSGELAGGVQVAVRYDTGIPGLIGETGTGMTYDPTMTHAKEQRRFATTNIPGYNYAR